MREGMEQQADEDVDLPTEPNVAANEVETVTGADE